MSIVFATGAAAQLDADFTAAPTSGVAALSVAFSDATTGGTPQFWIWDFGDGATQSGVNPNPTHTYLVPGTYTVTVTAFAGLSFDSETKVGFVTVDPPTLVVAFSASPTQGVNPLAVFFTDDSSGGTPSAWSWDFGDGSTSSLQNPTYTFTAPGSYTVSLTVFIGQQNATLTQANLVTVDPAPLVVDFDASPTQGDNPLQVSFTDTSTGATTTAWRWDFGDGSTSSLQNPTYTFTAPGSYTVSLTAFIGQQNATLTQANLVTVDPAPLVVDFSAFPTQGDTPQRVFFSDESSGATVTAWEWDFGDGSDSHRPNPMHTYVVNETTSFSVSLTAWVGHQSGAHSEQDFITVQAPPLEVDFTASPTSGVNPLPVLFTDLTLGPTVTAWQWDFGDGTGSTLKHPTHTYTGPGPYSVSLTASAGNVQASAVQPDLIVVDPAEFVVDFNASPGQGPSPLIVSFSDQTTGAPPTAWLWDFGDGTSTFLQNPTHTYPVSDTTTFSVSLTAFVGQQQVTKTSTNLLTVEPGPFSPEQVITIEADGANSVFARDLDGDGDADVLSASIFDDKIAWYENVDGLGSFGLQQVITTAADNPAWVHAADLDGDGDADVLSASAADNKIAWYENVDGLGGFGPQQVITTAAVTAFCVRTADLDDDGDTDVLSASADGKIAWYENTDGQGTFGPQLVITTEAAYAQTVFPADLDGDGDSDVLSASGNDNKIAWYENTDGLGSFGPQQIISTLALGARGAVAADLDGDGDLDALSVASIEDEIAWYENTDGLGAFGQKQVISTDAAWPFSVSSADLDGDGDVDALSASAKNNLIAWYENTDGQGSFGPQRAITTGANYANSVHTADLDGDGDADVLSASSAVDKIAWYSNSLATPPWPFLGNGLAGNSGIPVLTGDGELVTDEVVTLTLSNALPGSATALVIGLSALGAPFKGGVLMPNPDVVVAGLPIDGNGGLVLTDRWPPGISGGVTIWFQHWINDPAGPQGLAASNGVSGTTSP